VADEERARAKRLRTEAKAVMRKRPISVDVAPSALSALLEATAFSSLSIGICRLGSGDPQPLRPVLGRDGLRWECTDVPPHRTQVIARLEK
jgi:hypothetical protein